MNNLLTNIRLLALVYVVACSIATAQVGIGTSLPKARLHIYDGTFLARTQTLDPQNSPFYDPGNFDDDSICHALKWIHEKSAFRSFGGSIYCTTLNPASVGQFSFASGFETFSKNLGASAIGMRTAADGVAAFAAGRSTISTNFSFVQGYSSTADGVNCVTIGTNLHNNYLIGSFILGYTDFNAQSTSNNQIRMLFFGGYRLFSSSNLATGVLLGAGANSWSMVSDSKRKENFGNINGKEVLLKISALPLSSWNYKGQYPAHYRHYGPMAQDFFRAFGKDSYGTIGSDTTINQADLDGVSLIAIQALIQETDELEKMNDDLQNQLITLRKRVSANTGFAQEKRHALLKVKRK